MHIVEGGSIGISAIRSNKLRSLLTMLGIYSSSYWVALCSDMEIFSQKKRKKCQKYGENQLYFSLRVKFCSSEDL